MDDWILWRLAGETFGEYLDRLVSTDPTMFDPPTRCFLLGRMREMTAVLRKVSSGRHFWCLKAEFGRAV
jgi:hypothetical protein